MICTFSSLLRTIFREILENSTGSELKAVFQLFLNTGTYFSNNNNSPSDSDYFYPIKFYYSPWLLSPFKYGILAKYLFHLNPKSIFTRRNWAYNFKLEHTHINRKYISQEMFDNLQRINIPNMMEIIKSIFQEINLSSKSLEIDATSFIRFLFMTVAIFVRNSTVHAYFVDST